VARERRGREPRESTVTPIEAKRRWHVVELAVRKRPIVMSVLAGILLLFAIVGYYGVANVTLASQTGVPPAGVWLLLVHFMAIPLIVGGVAGALYMTWFIAHHEGSLQRSGMVPDGREVSERTAWRSLRISNRVYLFAYLVATALGIVAWFA